MNNKTKEMKKRLQKLGYELLDEKIINYKNVNIKDKNGYLYKANLNNLFNGEHPSFVISNNPYSAQNINVYLSKFDRTSLLISHEYINSKQLLKLKCLLCGQEYSKNWTNLFASKNKVCKKCAKKISISKLKIKPDKLEKLFESKGYKMLNDEYVNNSTPLLCEDINGYRYFISYANLKKQGVNRFPYISYPEIAIYNLNIFAKNNNLKTKALKIEIKNNRALVLFKCECGNMFYSDGYDFIKQIKTRCSACTKIQSNLEFKVECFLQERKLKYEKQYIFSECKNKKYLPFDFYLNDYNICIEVDGQQHYMPSFGDRNNEKNIQNFNKVKHNDKIKTDFCEKQNIKLIRIPYWDIIKSEKYKEKILQAL